jgi:hypothetical protein
VAVVDAVFKDGWTLPESETIKKAKGNDELNYYMIFSEKEDIGVDELLDYVRMTINVNIEREKKHELLKEMVNDLKLVFKKNTLTNLRRLRFTFGEEEVVPDLSEFDLDEPPTEKLEITNEIGLGEIKEVPVVEPLIESEPEVPLTEEDIEILEEEKRAATFFELQKQQKLVGISKKISSTIELPPKRKQEEYTETIVADCECGPDEACEKCIETKGY